MADHSNRNQELLQAVQDALKANDLLLVREIMQALHPSEVADLFEALPPETRDELWVHITEDSEGEVLSHASTAVRTGLLEHMAPEEVER